MKFDKDHLFQIGGLAVGLLSLYLVIKGRGRDIVSSSLPIPVIGGSAGLNDGPPGNSAGDFVFNFAPPPGTPPLPPFHFEAPDTSFVYNAAPLNIGGLTVAGGNGDAGGCCYENGAGVWIIPPNSMDRTEASSSIASQGIDNPGAYFTTTGSGVASEPQEVDSGPGLGDAFFNSLSVLSPVLAQAVRNYQIRYREYYQKTGQSPMQGFRI